MSNQTEIKFCNCGKLATVGRFCSIECTKLWFKEYTENLKKNKLKKKKK